VVFTALAGLFIAIISREGTRYHQSAMAADLIRKLGGSVHWNREIHENIIRDQTLSRITDVFFTNPRLDAKKWQSLSQLPLRFGLQIDGPSFTDDTITYLVGIKRLEYVVLSNTKVSEDAILGFQRQRPDVFVMIGYPGEPSFRQYPPNMGRRIGMVEP
jgi:hypothetical protein